MKFDIRKAERKRSKIKMSIDGPAGSGKTYTMLVFLCRLAEQAGGKAIVIDTENASSEKYQGVQVGDLIIDYDILPLDDYNPRTYADAIKYCQQQGYAAIGIDSLSHAWTGAGGALDLHDKASRRPGKNSYTAWGEITPLVTELVDAILQSKAHIIATMRSKVEYDMQKDNDGKTKIQKLGMKPIQREGMDYEFDVTGSMNVLHDLEITKSRYPELELEGTVIEKPGPDFIDKLLSWTSKGIESAEPEPKTFTKQDLIEYGRITYNMQPQDIASALQYNQMQFEGATEEELKIALQKYTKAVTE